MKQLQARDGRGRVERGAEEQRTDADVDRPAK
jgi:hypothetical protein